MPKSHRPYAPEFRQRIVELVRKGRTPEELARQFEPSAQAIRNWMKQAALDAGERTDGLTTEERDELRGGVPVTHQPRRGLVLGLQRQPPGWSQRLDVGYTARHDLRHLRLFCFVAQ